MRKSPKNFVSSIDLGSADALTKSVQFLFFAVICNEILRLPLDVVSSSFRMDPTLRITWLIIDILDPVLFGSAVWLFGKAVNGKGQYRNVLVAMLYSSAFMFLDTILAYIFLPHGGFDKQTLLDVLSGASEKHVGEFNTVDAISGFVSLIVSCYVYIKLVPLVAFVHSIGAIRASLVLACAYAADGLYVWFVGRPFLVDVVKGSIPK